MRENLTNKQEIQEVFLVILQITITLEGGKSNFTV